MKPLFGFFGQLFVDTLFTLWVLKYASSCWPVSPPGTQAPAVPWVLTQQCHNGQPLGISGCSLELTSVRVLHSHLTLSMEILISSVLVCLTVMVVVVNGSCCFCFVLLFNGRRWNFSCFSSNPTEKQLGLCFPFQTKRSRHVLDISVFAASIHPTPVLEKGLPAKQEATHS